MNYVSAEDLFGHVFMATTQIKLYKDNSLVFNAIDFAFTTAPNCVLLDKDSDGV